MCLCDCAIASSILGFSLDKMFTSRNRLYHVNIDPSAPSGTTRFNFDLQKHGVNNYMWYLNGVGIQIGQNGWSVNSDSDNLLVLQQSDSKKNLNTDDVGELTLRAISSSKGDYSTNKFLTFGKFFFLFMEKKYVVIFTCEFPHW